MKNLISMVVAMGFLVSLAWGQSLEDGHRWNKAGNYRKALETYLSLARQGNVMAMQWVLYMRRDVRGEQMDKAFQEAVGLIQKAAEDGKKEAQFFLADLYKTGVGVPIDNIKAQKWYCAAFEQGHERARKRLIGYDKKNPTEVCAR